MWCLLRVPSLARRGSAGQSLQASAQQREQGPHWSPGSSLWPVLSAPALPAPSSHLQEPLTSGQCHTLHQLPLMSLFCGFRVHPAPWLLKGFPPLSAFSLQSIKSPPPPPALNSNPGTGGLSPSDHLTPQPHSVISDAPSQTILTRTIPSPSWRSLCSSPASLAPILGKRRG